MKILVLCDQGNNRSVTLGHQLKYLNPGNDILTGGIAVLKFSTMAMLVDWADKVIVTDRQQYNSMTNAELIHGQVRGKIELWDLGPDTYPRPFNKELLAKVKVLVQQHREEI